MPGRTRIAPSPTGQLHLGHVAHLIYVVGLAKRWGLDVLLRMEDHDRSRCRPAFEASIYADLLWLQVPVTHGYTATTPDPYRQSDTPEVYENALQHFIDKGLVYACDCSRAAIEARLPQSLGRNQELPYDGHCRNRNLPLATPNAGLRVILPAGTITFNDLLLGPQTQIPASQCSDLLLRDRHRLYTYQFCVVVDDLRQGITHIIRGQDILPSTGRQLLLRELLGGDSSLQFYHHPLLLDTHTGEKLSKRELASPIQHLRDQGHQPTAVLGLAAHAIGLQATTAPLAWQDIEQLLPA